MVEPMTCQKPNERVQPARQTEHKTYRGEQVLADLKEAQCADFRYTLIHLRHQEIDLSLVNGRRHPELAQRPVDFQSLNQVEISVKLQSRENRH